MNIRREHVEPLKFKGSGIFPYGAASTHYYHIDAAKRRVVIIGNLTPQTVSHFDMTPEQFRDFKAGKLSLVPPNCCNPSGGRSLNQPKVLFSGTIESQKHLREILKTIIVVPDLPVRKNAVQKV